MLVMGTSAPPASTPRKATRAMPLARTPRVAPLPARTGSVAANVETP
jgi:hypothetical protein